MNSNISCNLKRITQREKDFYSELHDMNISSLNLTERFENNITDPVFYRDDAYHFAITTLNCSQRANLAITGDSGVGKTSFIHFLPKYLPLILPQYTLSEVSVPSILSGCAYRGEFEKKLISIIEMAIRYNVIVYFDEAHTLSMTGGNNGGGIDAINILKPYLTSGFKCIISTTTAESSVLRDDAAFSRRFRFLELQSLDIELKKKIVLSKFGCGGLVQDYLRNPKVGEKGIHEMIDEVDFMISFNKIKWG